MKEIILCKYGEIVLKGANKSKFEDSLCREMKKRAAAYGDFDVYRAQSTLYIEPKSPDADIDGMTDAACRVFGITTVSRAAVCGKTVEDICESAKKYIPPFLRGYRSFKVEGKRSDKSFPLNSVEISREVGGAILSVCPHISVDLNEPEITVKVEIREFGAYLSTGKYKGAGGLPTGTGGKGLLLLSGGIDSPVAGYMMAKRGLTIEAVHFESYPYTSELAREKVFALAKKLSVYSGTIYVHVVSLTKIQEELVKSCCEDYFTLLLRRYMMAIATMVAKKNFCRALITGESLGQVASQTIEALAVTDAVADMPVFRPCIGMDKEEIISIARKINTFDTSILPYEDCCTVFTPKHPRTRPVLEKVLAEEKKLDFAALAAEAFESMKTVKIEPEY